MRPRGWLFVAPLLLVPAALCALPAADPPAKDAKDDTGITWKKTVIDKKFRSEGVAVADVNKDGKMDVLTGEAWYEAPDWKMHKIRELGEYGDGMSGYSHSFLCWADDLNGDGYPDLIVIDFPGAPCYWFENPKGDPNKLWAKHIIWHSACNETPQYVDLFGDGKHELVMGFQPIRKFEGGEDGKYKITTTENQGQMAYFTPRKDDPTALWEMHPISGPSEPGKEVPGTQRFSHGLGVGDVNGDRRLDVICTGGWWEQPAKVEDQPWTFHPAALGVACADIFAYDMDGDGKADLLCSCAHQYGIWQFTQKEGKDHPEFVKQDLFKDLVSETHALQFVDINGDGLPDLVTGKRFWSHGKNEPGSDKAAMLYWFEAKKDADGITTFVPHVIDDDSGVGTQFVVADVNKDGLPDVVTSNKKGTFLFEQVRAKKEK
jgi:hypothetical protein